MSAISIDGDWVIPLILVVVGFFNWLSKKLKEEPKPPGQRPVSRSAPRPGTATSEEERMRKFLEALGLPPDATPAQPEQRPVVWPAPQPQRRQQKREKAPRPKIVRPQQVAPPPPLPHELSLDEAPAPSRPVEAIALPELSVPTVAEFTTVASQIAAAPVEPITPVKPSDRGPSRNELLRQEFSSAARLRSVFLAREILGPPRGLQSADPWS